MHLKNTEVELTGLCLCLVILTTASAAGDVLFPANLPVQEYASFKAEGYSGPVAGMIYDAFHPATNGVPLGGIDTGCLDLETNGTLGICTLFNSLVPRRGPLRVPFLGIAVGRRAWTLTSDKLAGVDCAKSVRYWGHYPIADMEYEIDAPVNVGLRAWAPFIPGDVAASNTPGIVFEVHVRNTSEVQQEGSVVFSFPGALLSEMMRSRFYREPATGVSYHGVRVHAGGPDSYVVGVIGTEKPRIGGELGFDGPAWAKIADELPTEKPTDSGASIAAGFNLAPQAEKVVRFLVTWYFPRWRGTGSWLGTGEAYLHMYASRFTGANAVADYIGEFHTSLLKRIIRWQEAIYDDKAYPGWLQDALINNFYLIAECSLWAQAAPPIGKWCRPEDGLFALSEDPRLCPQMECIPCSFCGNWNVLYFFPKLAISTLRAYNAYMQPNGAPPWIFGGTTGNTGGCDLIYPTAGYQLTLNGACLVDLVDRYWMMTGDDAFLKELYPAVKNTTIWTMNLNESLGPDGLISNYDTDWLEVCYTGVKGMTSHVAGVRLAQLRQAERMAIKMGDKEFASQCREWIKQASDSLENKLWVDGRGYLNFFNPETGAKSDLILANQLDGEWMVRLHGLPGVFNTDRVKTTLDTVKQTCCQLSPYGPVIFAGPNGGIPEIDPGYTRQGIFLAEAVMLGETYMYNGQREFGLEVVRKLVNNMAKRGMLWNVPCFIDGSNGVAFNGNDYSQFGVLWTLPAALENADLAGPTATGGLVQRIIAAGK